MAYTIQIHLNTSRSLLHGLPRDAQQREARRNVRMFLIPSPRQGPEMMSEGDVPDILVTDEMAERYIEIDPPRMGVIQEFQAIVNEIEQTYVLGYCFSALSASCVTIERLLNRARRELHQYHAVLRELWNKEALNDWGPNINALQKWGYLEDNFADELRSLYKNVRCAYLHSQPVGDVPADALRAATAAYKLLDIFVGFPQNLFTFDRGRLVCTNERDPRFLVFYKPHMKEEPASL